MQISIPYCKSHHQLCGGSVSWRTPEGRTRTRKILMVGHDGNKENLTLFVRGRGESPPTPDTKLKITRNV